MKRLSVSIALVLLLLCGCGGKGVSPILTDISFNASLECEGVQYQGSAQIDAAGVMSFEITAPVGLCGMRLVLTPNTTSAEFCGLSYDWGNTVQGSAIRSFYDVLSTVQGSVAPNGKNCVISTDEYSLTYSPAGLPIELKIPKKKITAEFSSIRLKEE